MYNTNVQHYISASEAAEELGVSLSTLYAYVSRGMIYSEAVGEGSRSHRYLREDVERLKARKEQRQNPAKAVETALNWGEPVLESAITWIDNGHLYYRGRDAIELAKTRTMEEVAGLIWLGDLNAKLFEDQLMRVAINPPNDIHIPNTPEKLQTSLLLAANSDLLAYDLTPVAVAKTGVRVLCALTGAISLDAVTRGGGVAHQLAIGWGVDGDHAAGLLNLALILCADHELNVSSFTARCVASAGSTPYEVVIAGLAALQGYKHGGATRHVEAFLREAKTPDGVQAAITSRIKRGDYLPGFGHQLYPDGDPRGAALIEQTSIQFPDSPAVRLGNAVIKAVSALNGLKPTIDFGLVMLAGALELPPGSALTLFGIGRTVGWIGHAIEQYELGTLIRPRARYTGIPPDLSSLTRA